MRTTVTLDAEAAAIVQRRMRERRLTFKQAINELLVESSRRSSAPPFRTPTMHLGQPRANLDRALQLAAEIEDEELIRKSRSGR